MNHAHDQHLQLMGRIRLSNPFDNELFHGFVNFGYELHSSY